MVRGKQHKAMADQLTTVSKKAGQSSGAAFGRKNLQAVEQAIRVQLNLTT